ncbi:hypothetical protein HY251_15405, partial [bacterium]|nr:hypothetical protein [bacterium]
MYTRRRLVVLGALGLIVASAAAQDGKGRPRRPRRVLPNGPDPVLKLEIKEATEGADEGDSGKRPPPAAATPLSDEDTKKVLARLSPLAADPGEDFALREGSLPPPRTGKTISEQFPPPHAPPAPDKEAAGPLQVLRHMPDGEVPLAPHFSVTFSQPMIAVTSHDDTIKDGVPVKLTPEASGAWRWIGTKTLLFEPKGRFPMATRYTAEIAAGTTSATGGKLEKAERFTFSTPPPQVVFQFPTSGPQKRDPLLLAAFDQTIDAEAVLPTIEVKDSSGKKYDLKLQDAEHVSKDPTVHSLASQCQPGRWLAFRATEIFPTDTQVNVTIGPGTPSAEGPRKTERPQTSSFKTYGPLKLVHQWPQAGQETPPFSGWSLGFSNPLDTESFKKELVKVEPELPGIKVSAWGNNIQIHGAAKGRTTYKVTVSSALADIFGNTLGHDEKVSFKVGSAPESFHGQQGLVVLDPSGPPRYSLYSINEKKLKLRVWSVTPENWNNFHALNQNWYNNRNLPEPGGKLVIDKTIKPEGADDELTETRIDISEALDSGLGHAVLIIEPTKQPEQQWQRRALIAWIESTKIGLDACVDNERFVAWASALKDGKPLSGVSMKVAPSSAGGTTGADGLASFVLPSDAMPQGACLVATKGKDTAILPEQTWWWSGASAWQKPPVMGDYLRWYVADDRHLYKPGEEVHVKGWIRKIGSGPLGDVKALEGAASKIDWKLTDSRGNEIAKGEKKINAAGGFDLAFSLPKTVNLGWTNLQLTADGGAPGSQHFHNFEVQEFRRPEFEVTAQASEGPHMVGGSGTATVSASYYAGGGLPGAEVTWNVSAQAGSFSPPNQGDFTFGTWRPWWEYWGGDFEGATGAVFQGRTDSSGKHKIQIAFEHMAKPRPVSVTAYATVMDVNRQAWAASASFLVHPSELYVGLKSPRTFVQKGEPLVVDAIACDVDGKLALGTKIALRCARLDWVFENGSYQQKEEDVQEASLDSAKDPVRATFTTKEGGTYKVTASVKDKKERENESQLTLWVAGGKQPPSRDVHQEKVTLIP